MDESIRDQVKKIIEEPLDWEFVLGQANFHKIAELLYNNIRAITASRTNINGIIKILEKVYMFNRLWNTYYLNESKIVLETLQDAGINVVVIKGPLFFTEKIYEDIGLRASNEVDILISRNDSEKIGKFFYLHLDFRQAQSHLLCHIPYNH